MNLLNKIERQFPSLSFKNITLILILGQVLVFILNKMDRLPFERIFLNWHLIMMGEVWRIFSFLLIPISNSFFFVIFAWYLYYLYGTSLENYWGVFKYNLYLLTSIIATVLTSILFPYQMFHNYYIFLSIFFAFAYLNPNFEIFLFFVLRVKIKWIAWLTFLVIFVTGIVQGSLSHLIYLTASFINFPIFFGKDIFYYLKYRKKTVLGNIVKTNTKKTYFHKCISCGITDVENKKLEFRYESSEEKQRCFCENCLK